MDITKEELLKLLRHGLDAKEIFYDRQGLVDIWDLVKSRPFKDKVLTEESILCLVTANPEVFIQKDKEAMYVWER